MNFNSPKLTLSIRGSLFAVIVCHCKAVTDHAVRDAVRDGARSCRQIARACEAGRSCGGCRPAIREIIESERERTPLFNGFDELATT